MTKWAQTRGQVNNNNNNRTQREKKAMQNNRTREDEMTSAFQPHKSSFVRIFSRTHEKRGKRGHVLFVIINKTCPRFMNNYIIIGPNRARTFNIKFKKSGSIRPNTERLAFASNSTAFPACIYAWWNVPIYVWAYVRVFPLSLSALLFYFMLLSTKSHFFVYYNRLFYDCARFILHQCVLVRILFSFSFVFPFFYRRSLLILTIFIICVLHYTQYDTVLFVLAMFVWRLLPFAFFRPVHYMSHHISNGIDEMSERTELK